MTPNGDASFSEEEPCAPKPLDCRCSMAACHVEHQHVGSMLPVWLGCLSAHDGESAHRNTDQFCLLSMADSGHRRIYKDNLLSHACYARRHRYISAVEDCPPWHAGETGVRSGAVPAHFVSMTY